jgi:hypothetical protein
MKNLQNSYSTGWTINISFLDIDYRHRDTFIPPVYYSWYIIPSTISPVPSPASHLSAPSVLSHFFLSSCVPCMVMAMVLAVLFLLWMGVRKSHIYRRCYVHALMDFIEVVCPTASPKLVEEGLLNRCALLLSATCPVNCSITLLRPV